jgi:hypothetical protein
MRAIERAAHAGGQDVRAPYIGAISSFGQQGKHAPHLTTVKPIRA